ncbi:MAG: hypothetical protein ACRC68_13635 [Clostridium sp.]
MKKKCLYCKELLEEKHFKNKIGKFCSAEHYDKYYSSLSNEEIVQIMNSMCVCSDE